MTQGVSETERQRREESNHFGAKITFAAWLVEVFLKCTHKIRGKWNKNKPKDFRRLVLLFSSFPHPFLIQPGGGNPDQPDAC